MGQKASKPAGDTGESAKPRDVAATQQTPTTPVQPPVIKDQSRESVVPEKPILRPVAALPSTINPPIPRNVVASSTPAVRNPSKGAFTHVVKKGEDSQDAAQRRLPQEEQPVQQKQSVQQKQQKQQIQTSQQQHQSQPHRSIQQNQPSPNESLPQKKQTAQKQAQRPKPPQPQHDEQTQQQKPPHLQQEQPQQKQPQQKQPQQKQPQPQNQNKQQKPSQSTSAAPQNQQTSATQPAKPGKQKKANKRAKQTPASVTATNTKRPPRKPLTTPEKAARLAGKSLRDRMSSPPKLIVSQDPKQGDPSAAISSGVPPVANHTASAALGVAGTSSSVSSKSGEKRRLNDDEEVGTIRPTDSVVGQSSPRQRQSKIVRRDGDTDTASARATDIKTLAPDIKTLAPVPTAVVPEEEKEEGEISDEEMDKAPLGKTSLLHRLSDAQDASSTASATLVTPSFANGSGSLSARMDPALMARIDPRGVSYGHSTSKTYYQPPPPVSHVPYPAKPLARNGKAATPVTKAPASIMERLSNAPIRQWPSADDDVTMRNVKQPRMTGVIGRSGVYTTVNGVAIPTGEGQGDNKLDEAGQRELIEIIVELHNKGISTAELTQRGVPAQLINRVMKALSHPAPPLDVRSVTPSGSSSEARVAHQHSHSAPAPGTDTHTAVVHDVDMDMDMDIDSGNDESPNLASNVSQLPGSGMQYQPPLYPFMPMMPPFPPMFIPASVHSLPPKPPQMMEPAPPLSVPVSLAPPLPQDTPAEQPPPPPPASSIQPPLPPPVDVKSSLKDLKARLLANRKLKQRNTADLDTPEPSDLDTPTVTPTLTHFAVAVAEKPVIADAAEQDTSAERATKMPSPRPPSMSANLIPQSGSASRADSPAIASSRISAVTAVNSRRPGAADFVDVPPSRLSSSTFFRSNVRRTFALPQPKRLVIDLDDNSDDSDDDGHHNPDTEMLLTGADTPGNEANALREMHEAELRTALERKKAELLENRAKLAAYASRKKGAAQSTATPESTEATPSPILESTGLSLTAPILPETASASPLLSSTAVDSPAISKATLDTKNTVGKDMAHAQDKGKRKAHPRDVSETGRMNGTADKAVTATSSIIDLTDDTGPSEISAVAVLPSTHFKPYHFFTPHPLTSTPSNSQTFTDVLDLDQLKRISLSRMLAEHRQRAGKAKEDPVVCKYELRGGACNVPDCPDFHMRKDIVASQQDLLRYIDTVIPAKKSSPSTITTARQHLQQLVRSKPDIPPKLVASDSSETAANGNGDAAAHAKAQKIKLIKQRKTTLLYQARESDVAQFLEELRKTLRNLAVSADDTAR